MHFTNSLTLLCLTAIAQAFTIPAGTQDGSYMVRRNADGIDEHVLVARSASPGVSLAREAATVLEKKATVSIYCGCGLDMDRGNCDAAVQNVKDQMRGGTITINVGQSYYAIRNNVVAFICNIRGISNTARSTNANIFANVLRDVTNRCGLYVPGAGLTDSEFLVYGYQIWSPNTDCCGNWNKGRQSC